MSRSYDFMGEHWLEDPDQHSRMTRASGASADPMQLPEGDYTHTVGSSTYAEGSTAPPAVEHYGDLVVDFVTICIALGVLALTMAAAMAAAGMLP